MCTKAFYLLKSSNKCCYFEEKTTLKFDKISQKVQKEQKSALRFEV